MGILKMAGEYFWVLPSWEWHKRDIGWICCRVFRWGLWKYWPVSISRHPFSYCVFIVVFTWRENRDNQKNKTALGLFPIAWEKILNDPKIMLVGFTNAFFEGAMYTFVFNWVPSMYNVWENPPLGNVFSSFMTCITLGGFIYNYLSSSINMTNGEIMLYVLLFASISLMLPAIDPDHFYFVYGGFLVFETCVGVSFACGGGLRSAVMPEELQATIMNIFRIPLNILVVIGTRLDSFATTRQVFLVCVSWLLVALLLQYWFMKRNMMESTLRAAKANQRKRSQVKLERQEAKVLVRNRRKDVPNQENHLEKCWIYIYTIYFRTRIYIYDLTVI